MKRQLRKAISHILACRQERRLKKGVLNAHHDVIELEDGIFDARKYGFSLSESKVYRFPQNDYREYISTWESYQPRFQNSKNILISDDKLLFSLVFQNIVEVPEIYAVIQNGKVHPIGKNVVSADTLYDFILCHDGGIIKDRGGCDGFGVLSFSVAGGNVFLDGCEIKRAELKERLRKISNAIFQKRLKQGAFENSLYDKTVNTIRIITVKKPDSFEHEVIGALQRIGTSKSYPVDNFNQGGGSALIDLETGRMSAMACAGDIDKDGNQIFYDEHPDSGAQIRGIVIPNWENVKQQVLYIARRVPLFDYVAWDVVLKDDGIAIIETNMKSSLHIFQIHGGMRNTYLGQKYREYGYLDH